MSNWEEVIGDQKGSPEGKKKKIEKTSLVWTRHRTKDKQLMYRTSMTLRTCTPLLDGVKQTIDVL